MRLPTIHFPGDIDSRVVPTDPYEMHIVPASNSDVQRRIQDSLCAAVGGVAFSVTDRFGVATCIQVAPTEQNQLLPLPRQVADIASIHTGGYSLAVKPKQSGPGSS